MRDPVQPKMSGPFEHLHVDLAGPFPIKQVRAEGAGRGRKGAASTQRVGQAYVLLIVDYFTKAAEFVYIPDRKAATVKVKVKKVVNQSIPIGHRPHVSRAFHDRWLMRFGVPEWVTADNGQEFGSAFRHHVCAEGCT